MHLNHCLGAAALVASALTLEACMEPMEPTPVSPIVRIAPTNGFATATELPKARTFSIEIGLTNTSSGPIYADVTQRFLEKLVNQKWQLADATPIAPFSGTRKIDPSMTFKFQYQEVYLLGGTASLPLLEHLRGVYRAHFRLALDAAGNNPIDSALTYSQPFAVNP